MNFKIIMILVMLCIFSCASTPIMEVPPTTIFPDDCDTTIEYKHMYRLEVSYPTCEGCDPLARFCKDPTGHWIALKDVDGKINVVYVYPLIEAFIIILEENCTIKNSSNPKILISY